MQATHTYLQIHPDDNILVALQDLPKGTEIRHNGHQFSLIEAVAGKHKFTMNDLAPGEEIFMYGVLVGKADKPIPQGAAITTSNIHHASSDFSLGERKLQWKQPDVGKYKERQFMGYHRADGSVGTANYWVVIPMVFCENRNVDVLKEALIDKLGYAKTKAFEHDVESLVNLYQQGVSEEEILAMEFSEKTTAVNNKKVFKNIDGIKFLNHEMGCGGTRMDADALCGLLAGYVTHPNVAGATILSLGCQHAQASILKQEILKRDPDFSKPFIVLEQQKEGTEKQLLTKAIKKTFAGLMEANKNERKPAPLSKTTARASSAATRNLRI